MSRASIMIFRIVILFWSFLAVVNAYYDIFNKEALDAIAYDDLNFWKYCTRHRREPGYMRIDDETCMLKGNIKKEHKGNAAAFYLKKIKESSFDLYYCRRHYIFSIDLCNCSPLDDDELYDSEERYRNRGGKFDNRINTQNGTGWSLLHFASWHGSTRVVRDLIKRGANIFIENDEKEQPVHLAAFRNHVNVLRILFAECRYSSKKHRLIFAKTETGQTPLIYAVRGKASATTSELIQLGAILSDEDKFGLQPIHYAIKSDNADMVELLRRKGALLTSKCCFSDVKTGFHIAAESNSVHIFENSDLNLMLSNYLSRNPYQAKQLMCLSVAKGSLAFVKHLLTLDQTLASTPACSFGNKEKSPRTGKPINSASFHSNLPIVEVLVQQNGVDINYADSKGSTPLLTALQIEASHLVEFLLLNGADTNVEDSDSKTPFLLAVVGEMNSVAKLLIQKGADPFTDDEKGQSALHLITDAGLLEFIFLNSQGSTIDRHINMKTSKEAGGVTPLLAAIVGMKSNEIIRLLLNYGADSSIQDDWQKYTAFHFAIEFRNIGVINLLLENWPSANIPEGLSRRDRMGRTAFLMAVEENFLPAVKVLVEKGDADVNDLVTSDNAESALHLAARSGSSEVVIYLVQSGADVSFVTNIDGRNVLLEALHWRNFKCIKHILQKHSTDILLRDSSGRNALHYTVLYDAVQLTKNIAHFVKSVDRKKLVEFVNCQDQNEETPLHYAVKLNNFDIISFLLTKTEANCLIKNKQGFSPIHLAAQYRYLAQLKQFHSTGNCDLAQLDDDGLSALEYPGVKCQPDFVEKLVNNYGGTCSSCKEFSRKLKLAIKLRMKSMVTLILLESQRLCNSRKLLTVMHEGSSAFDIALLKHDYELILLAFDSGALDREMVGETDHKSKFSMSMVLKLLFGSRLQTIQKAIVHIERSIGEENVRCSSDIPRRLGQESHFGNLAMENHYNGKNAPDLYNNENRATSYSAFQTSRFQSKQYNEYQEETDETDDKYETMHSLSLLLDRTGFDVNEVLDPNGNTLLHYFAVDRKSCNLEVTEGILLRGASPNVINRAGLAPLHLIALSQHKCPLRFVKLFMQYGANTDLESTAHLYNGDTSLTPMHLAASRCGNIELIDAFIETPITVAYRRRKKDLSNFQEVNASSNSTDKKETQGFADEQLLREHGREEGKFTITMSRNANANTESKSFELPPPLIDYTRKSNVVRKQPNVRIDINRNTNANTESKTFELPPPPDDNTAKLDVVRKQTKLGKTVAMVAAENNRYDVLERLEKVDPDQLSLLSTKKSRSRSRSRTGRGVQENGEESIGTCQFLIEKYENKLSKLNNCSNRLDEFARTSSVSFDLMRRAVVSSTKIVNLNGLKKKFYFPLPGSYSFEQAEQSCLERGASLAQIRNKQEQGVLQTIKASLYKPLWVGLKRGEVNSNQLWWSDGTRLSPEHQVKGSRSSQCATISLATPSDLKFLSNDCNRTAKAALCELEFPLPEFRIIYGSFSWQEAVKGCLNTSNKAFSLAMPKTRIQFETALQTNGWPNDQTGWQGCWIGLRRIPSTGVDAENSPKFQWIDQTFLEPPSSFPWLPGQPAAIGGADDCVELFSPSHLEPGRSGKLNDLPCNFTLQCALCYHDYI